MKETSVTARDGTSGMSSGFMYLALKFSLTHTRGSLRSDHASWFVPTSTAMTRLAPCCSRQSVNPPVELPTSRHVLPSAERPVNFAKAPSSFSPPLDTNRGGCSSSTTAASSIWRDALRSTCPQTRTLPSISKACALLRLSQRPRSTRRVSSLLFTAPARSFRRRE